MRWLVVLVCVAGCNSLFGLHGESDRDHDGDRVPDAVDNCPDVFNPDQSDIDGNSIGDACQSCVATDPTDTDGDGIPDQCDGCDNLDPDLNHNGIPDSCEHLDAGVPTGMTAHDEDGDGVADSVDLCPSVADPAQLDTDKDGVGDACDPNNATKQVQFFDGFGTRNRLWYVVGQGWTVAMDRATVALGNTEQAMMAGVGFNVFTVTTNVSVAALAVNAGVFIASGPSLFGTTRLYCEYESSGGTSAHLVARGVTSGGLQLGPAAAAFNPTGAFKLVLSYTYLAGTGATTFSCSALDAGPGAGGAVAVVPLQSAPGQSTWFSGIVGDGAGSASFDYVDVITNAQ